MGAAGMSEAQPWPSGALGAPMWAGPSAHCGQAALQSQQRTGEINTQRTSNPPGWQLMGNTGERSENSRAQAQLNGCVLGQVTSPLSAFSFFLFL